MKDPVDAEDGPRDADEPMLYCPVCSQRLVARKTCGHYMSWADDY
jgi:hypothetical protein